MSAFLSAEETLLDRKAGCFSTADLETVNRGLVLIRDLHWGLDHDILDNVQKIIDLAGAGGVADVAPEALSKYRKLNIASELPGPAGGPGQGLGGDRDLVRAGRSPARPTSSWATFGGGGSTRNCAAA